MDCLLATEAIASAHGHGQRVRHPWPSCISLHAHDRHAQVDHALKAVPAGDPWVFGAPYHVTLRARLATEHVHGEQRSVLWLCARWVGHVVVAMYLDRVQCDDGQRITIVRPIRALRGSV